MKYESFPLLTNLRGIAALIVVLSHASNSGLYLLPGLNFSGSGRYGVYLFFLLSAFLLTSQLHKSFTSGASFRRVFLVYLTHRFTRIYPLFVAMLLIYYLAYVILGAPNYINGTIDLVEHLFLLDGDGIFWTIPVEFKFYFLLPFIVLLYIRLKPKLFFKIFIFSSIFFSILPTVYDGSLHPFIGIFCLGCIMYFQHKEELDTMLMRCYLVVSILGFILIIPSSYELILGVQIERTYFHSFLLLHCILFFPWIHLCVNKDKWASVFNFSLFKRLGEISFSLYLIHPLILLGAKPLTKGLLTSQQAFFIYLIVAFVSAHYSWLIIEVGLRKSWLVRKVSYYVANKVSYFIDYLLGLVQRDVFK